MAHEEVKREIISVFSEAGKDIHLWLEELDIIEIERLRDAATVVSSVREAAVRRQRQKLD